MKKPAHLKKAADLEKKAAHLAKGGTFEKVQHVWKKGGTIGIRAAHLEKGRHI